ncbi:RusA family crossover junction endodeoxyribonuclease [Lactococcus lactis]|uniref:RusA family crossover junction endodeoxyribonuclease n=2 Tax=Lactococcus lactis TaxID=1358 RepID=UPI00288DE682|nr:RusA family crossover junction endodeoxyribonuclease [Lactococcus lactis]MDT2872849.1 RusA family crossover junction endodeoxyribonuclease [Lactococcus lactis]MDT2934686.1 RusA family crossover junction endodeoxyribonuclease [Lactococcus lactis]
MKFEFFMDKMPTTRQQKGIKVVKGQVRSYNRGNTANYELQKNLLMNKPKVPFDKGVAVTLKVYFVYGTKDKKKWGKRKITRPDGDNLMKGFQDYMQHYRYFMDDAQIAPLIVDRFWGQNNKIIVELFKTDESLIMF